MARVRTGESVLARGVRIVESFGLGDSALTVTEIARRSGLHVATASRLIEEFTSLEWLERDGRRVRIGVRLWEVASRASPTVGLREAAMPFMEDLHSVVGHDIQLGVFDSDEVLFVERLSSPGGAVNYSRVAGRLPLHASSAGLVLLAHAPADAQDRVLARPLTIYTEATIGTELALRRTLAEVRRQGFALCRGHIFPDTAGLAVPVRDAAGAVVAALSLIVPNDGNAAALIPMLQAAGRGISRVMSTTGPP